MSASASLALTRRDVAILETLTHRVRVLSLDQVGRTWWGTTRTQNQNARARLAELEWRGLVDLFECAVHPELDLARPLIVWRLGASTPALGQLAYRLESR